MDRFKARFLNRLLARTVWCALAVLAGDAMAQRYYGSGSNYQRPPDPPEHYSFLSGDCRSLNDALRTAPSRGLTSESMNSLHREWNQRCEEDDRDARRRFYEQQRDGRKARADEKKVEAAVVAQNAAKKQQCDEMLRILTNKRRRTDLNDGEKADLQRFESNYRERCS